MLETKRRRKMEKPSKKIWNKLNKDMRCENHGYSDTFEASRLDVETAFAKLNGATVITRQLEKSLSKLGEVNPDGCADFIQGISKLKNDILLLADENAKLKANNIKIKELF